MKRFGRSAFKWTKLASAQDVLFQTAVKLKAALAAGFTAACFDHPPEEQPRALLS